MREKTAGVVASPEVTIGEGAAGALFQVGLKRFNYAVADFVRR